MKFGFNQPSVATPFDNSSNGFSATNAQNAVEEVYDTLTGLVSPGFTWGRSGNIPSGSWLLNDSVPSNVTGRNFPFYNGELIAASISNENTTTANIEIYEHDKTTFTLIGTVTLTAQKSKEQSFTSTSVTKGKELAVKIGSGSAKNIVVQFVLKGTLEP